MARIKLGELLLKEKLISQKELEEALKAQMIYGGRLGTNLIELGYIDDETLAYTLSEKLGLPYANPATLMDVSHDVLKVVPKELAEKYKLVPVEISKRRLSVVMGDPEDIEAIKDLSFMTGYIIQPMVTPELKLWQALEKHYGIKQKKRFETLDRDMGVRKSQEARGNLDYLYNDPNEIDLLAMEQENTEPEVIPVRKQKPVPEKREARPVKSEPPAKAAAPKPEPVMVDILESGPPDEGSDEKKFEEIEDVYEKTLRDKIKRLQDKKDAMLKGKATIPPLAASKSSDNEKGDDISVSPITKDALLSIREASGRDELIDLLLDYAVKRFPRAIMLQVKKDTVIGMKGRGKDFDDAKAKRVRIPLSVPSIFKDVDESREIFFGKMPPDPMNTLFKGILGVKDAEEVLVVAMFFKDAVVSYLACVGEPTISKRKLVLDMEAASKSGSEAFERLIKGG